MKTRMVILGAFLIVGVTSIISVAVLSARPEPVPNSQLANTSTLQTAKEAPYPLTLHREPAINGAVNPNLISDDAALLMMYRAATPGKDELGFMRARSYLKFVLQLRDSEEASLGLRIVDRHLPRMTAFANRLRQQPSEWPTIDRERTLALRDFEADLVVLYGQVKVSAALHHIKTRMRVFQ